MIPIDATVLRSKYGSTGEGHSYEQLIYDLLQGDALACRLPLGTVESDHRTHVPDGGRDIVVRAGDPKGRGVLILSRPATWSIKSGTDGAQASAMEKEIADEKKHPKVLAALRRGEEYVWCTLQATLDQHDALRARAKVLADRLGFSAEQIRFAWVEDIATALRSFPGVVAAHLPEFAERFGLSVDKWHRRTPRLAADVPWVNFDDRDEIVQQIRRHLHGEGTARLLHVGGISGIGKTRTVLQAVETAPDLRASVRYYEQFEDLNRQLNWLGENPHLRLLAVVDETTVGDWDALCQRTAGLGESVRIVSIGPVRRDQRASRTDMIVLPEPQTSEAVATVLRSAAGSRLKDEVFPAIAEACNHDLRLGILLVQVVLRDPELAKSTSKAIEFLFDQPLLVYKRVLTLFHDYISDFSRFAEDYARLTFAVDVGMEGDTRDEIAFLAAEAGREQGDLQAAAEVARKCGLGTRLGRFFEASPRALAVLVFEEHLWPKLKDALHEILKRVPNDRLRRAFVQRVELCKAGIQEEARRACGEYFRGRLSGGGPEVLEDREVSRTFAAWTELYPADGLSWLHEVVRGASIDDLRAFPGSSGIFGPMGGRRDVVWLCENLACFSEHFRTCEDILFRLAVAENEAIGNNATNSWKARFRSVFSNTEVPFRTRLALLFDRLSKATSGTVELILGAPLGALQPHLPALVPPNSVGGRVVPDEWRPKDLAEESALLDELVVGVVETLERTETANVRAAGAAFVASNINRFWRPNAGSALRRFLSHDLTPQALRGLRASLQDVLDIHGDKFSGSDQIRAWVEDLRPRDVSSLLKEVVSRQVWEHRRHARRTADGNDQAWKEPYQKVASQLLTQPEVLREVTAWLGSGEARSARALGAVLAEQDGAEEGTVKAWVSDLIASGTCDELAIGFLATLRLRLGSMPAWAAEALDALISTSPARAASLSAEADASKEGLLRILESVKGVGVDRSRALQMLFGAEWKAVLTPLDCLAVMKALLDDSAGSSPPEYATVALHLLSMWQERNAVPPHELHEVLVQLTTRPSKLVGVHSLYEWEEVARQAIQIQPQTVLPKLAQFAFDFENREEFRLFEDAAVKLLRDAAPKYGDLILEALTPYVTNAKASVIFFIDVYRQFFESIGADRVITWVKRLGIDAARAVARHVQSPYVGEKDALVIPPLTKWLLDHYGEDERFFREFLLGRHSMEVRTGRASDWGPPRRRAVEPFLNHMNPAVARWALHEINSLEAEVKFDEQREAEEGRL